jgi:hypothetical protein
MGRAIAVRTDYRSGDIRRIAQRVKNAAQARRLLAIATVLDGAARQEAVDAKLSRDVCDRETRSGQHRETANARANLAFAIRTMTAEHGTASPPLAPSRMRADPCPCDAMELGHRPQRPDWLAGVVRLELRNLSGHNSV